MKVFLSWSGERSRAVAEALRDWLPLILQHVEPWVSDADLGAGERWAGRLASELEEANCGVICVTPENSKAPWLLFEAGSLAKSLQEGRVTPYLLGLDYGDLTGPLAQFQAKKSEKGPTLELVQDLNDHSGSPLDSSAIGQLFELLWPKLAAALSVIPEAPSSRPSRTNRDIMEDLVATVRAMDQRLRRLEDRITNSEEAEPAFEGPALEIVGTILAAEYQGGQDFSLGDAYSLLEGPLSRAYPRNRHIRPKIRQKLQELRDAGLIEFLGGGRYRLSTPLPAGGVPDIANYLRQHTAYAGSTEDLIRTWSEISKVQIPRSSRRIAPENRKTAEEVERREQSASTE